MIKFNIRGNKNSTEFNNIQEFINFCKGNNIISDDELFVYDSCESWITYDIEGSGYSIHLYNIEDPKLCQCLKEIVFRVEDIINIIELSEKGLCDEGILISFLYYYEGYSNDIVNEYTIALSTYFKKYPYHEFDSIIKDYYDINLSATDLCNYIDSFKFLRDKFNIVDFDDCWYLYHKTN